MTKPKSKPVTKHKKVSKNSSYYIKTLSFKNCVIDQHISNTLFSEKETAQIDIIVKSSWLNYLPAFIF